MVSSYLICDLCGECGPPARFLTQDGLRLCCRCWYVQQGGTLPEDEQSTPISQEDTGGSPKSDPTPKDG